MSDGVSSGRWRATLLVAFATLVVPLFAIGVGLPLPKPPVVAALVEPALPPPVALVVQPEPEPVTLRRTPVEAPAAPVAPPAAPAFNPFPRWARGDSVVFLLAGV